MSLLIVDYLLGVEPELPEGEVRMHQMEGAARPPKDLSPEELKERAARMKREGRRRRQEEKLARRRVNKMMNEIARRKGERDE